MKKKFLLPLFLLIQFLLLKVLAFFPWTVERYYSNGIYVWISKINRSFFGLFHFSIGDIGYAILLLLLLKWLYSRRLEWKLNWKSNLLEVVSAFSIFYFMFHFLWALNYYRVPLSEKLTIELDYTDRDLLEFTQKLILKTNEIHGLIEPDATKKVVFPYSQETVFLMNLKGYESLSKEFSFIKYSTPSIKKSLFSVPLSYMGFGGYLNPFTNEAQVNDLGPMYHFPMIATHEMAHQIGFASESEANFVGFMATIKNDDLYFQYSGYSFALRYCLYHWKIRDEKMFTKLKQAIRPGILKNYEENETFWKEYETFVESGFKLFYDTFLKLNQQKDGLESYSKFLNLAINYCKKNPL